MCDGTKLLGNVQRDSVCLYSEISNAEITLDRYATNALLIRKLTWVKLGVSVTNVLGIQFSLNLKNTILESVNEWFRKSVHIYHTSKFEPNHIIWRLFSEYSRCTKSYNYNFLRQINHQTSSITWPTANYIPWKVKIISFSIVTPHVTWI